MMRIVNIEEIEELLLVLPTLVQQQKLHSVDFALNVAAWLNSLEKVFVANHLYQAGSITTLRSGLVATEQGQVPAGLEFRGRPTRSRVLNAVAAQALQRATEVASNLIAENRLRFVEAERVVQQIVAVAVSRGLITTREDGVNTTQYLQMLRRSLITSNDLEGAFVHLEGLVGPHDALILFDRAITLYFEATSPAIHSESFPSSR